MVGIRNSPSSLRNPTSVELNILKDIAVEENRNVILECRNGEGVRGKDLALLVNGDWLNSEIVNTFFELLKNRSERYRHQALDATNASSKYHIHILNSFFYTKYEACGYQGIQRWTRKLNLFDFDLILLPINHNNLHWSLVVVNFRVQEIQYYDSLLSESKMDHYKHILSLVSKYLAQEAKSKERNELKMNVKIVQVPQQVDACSCGVFTCAYADLVSRGYSPSLLSMDMRKFELGMAADILRGFIV